MKIMVYTAITGDYDTLKEIKYIDKEIDYYCFTNNPTIKSKTWKIVPLENPELLDFVRLERKIKILGCEEIFKNYDLAIYMDANIELRKPVSEFIKNECDLKNYDFFSIIHSDRDCIYEEAKVCIEWKKDDKKIIEEEMTFLKKEKFPKHYGLTANNFFAFKTNNAKIKKIQNCWWNMVKRYSRRDQLSFMYSLWKNKYKKTQIITILWHDNKYFFIHEHNKSKEMIIEELNEKISLLEQNLNNVQKENGKQETTIKDLQSKLIYTEAKLEKILNSKSWNYISKIRNAYNKIKPGGGLNYFNKILSNY